jgi:RimJ/RimL family protein N-acetyltransferase
VLGSVDALPDVTSASVLRPPTDAAAVTSPDELPASVESERLVIRVARPGDGVMFHAAIAESHAELAPWLGWVSPAPTPAQSETSCRRAYARFLMNEDLMAFFLLKDGGVLVGGSGLHRVDWALRHFEVGYWGRTGWTGRGLLTEGVRALAEHALTALQASRVFLTTDDRNVASWRLAERAGFTHEGTLRNERRDLQGRLRDTRVYACTPARTGVTG